jgi:hypothetical protein
MPSVIEVFAVREKVSQNTEGHEEKPTEEQIPEEDTSEGDVSLPESGVALPIEWKIPPDLVTRPSTNIIVQHTEHEFTISFFEVQQPFLLGTREQNRATLEKLGSVPMICVARLVVSASRMRGFVKALETNWQQYLSKFPKLDRE